MSEAVFDVPSSSDVFLARRDQPILVERLKAGTTHAHIAIMRGALWRMRRSTMTFEERRAELEADMITTRRCAARWLRA